MNELEAALERLSRTFIPDESLDAIERVQRATDNQGNVVIKGRPFIELSSPDGTVWRLRVDNSGNLYTAEAPI